MYTTKYDSTTPIVRSLYERGTPNNFSMLHSRLENENLLRMHCYTYALACAYVCVIVHFPALLSATHTTSAVLRPISPHRSSRP